MIMDYNNRAPVSTRSAVILDGSAETCNSCYVGLAVSDLEAALTFFEALGYKVEMNLQSSYPSVFLSNGLNLLTIWKSKKHDETVFDPCDRSKNAGLDKVALQLVQENSGVSLLDALQDAYDAVSAKFGGER
jgi:catechol 2,3-dioxygenase-like lactoylglutathione lyase family enzyme